MVASGLARATIYILGIDASPGWVEGLNEPPAVPTPSGGSFFVYNANMISRNEQGLFELDDVDRALLNLKHDQPFAPSQLPTYLHVLARGALDKAVFLDEHMAIGETTFRGRLDAILATCVEQVTSD
ncbi:MAG TPA: hypothetical protein VLG27_04455 [Candidatus Saccharimonadia bacterium]|nr:hypothetical protein [Candidatus Saccharimonadia bacterium]